MGNHKHEYMFWTDLETTGSTLDDNQIIEIGAAITDMDLNIIDGREYVLPITRLVEMKPIVIDMHTKNGLLKDSMASRLDINDVDAEIAEWIRKYNGTNHMLLAGSGVMHFDRQFIKRDLPLTNSRLTYYAIDVGVVRRFTELVCRLPWIAENKSHRAYGDVLFHIEEAKYARGLLIDAGSP